MSGANVIEPSMATPAIPEVHYRLDAPARGHFPGAHRSRRGDSGHEFRGHASLLDAPDARRLDLHASLRDPFGQWIVRVYSQRKSVPVAIVADLSASMGFRADGPQARRRLDVVADFAQSLAWSAWRHGDSFGFVGGDDALRDRFTLPPSRSRGVAQALAQDLRGFEPAGRSAEGLRDAHSRLGRLRTLVFLVSDFHWPLPQLASVLASLAPHAVVPVVVWDPAEFALSAPHGLADVRDPESGRARTIWWRPALREQWRQAHEARRAALWQTFRAARLRPLFVEGAYDAEAVTRHFLA